MERSVSAGRQCKTKTAALSWKSYTWVSRGGREGTAGGVRVTETWRLWHSSTHGLCDWALHRWIANTTASPRAPWRGQFSPSVYSKAEEFHRGKMTPGRQTSKLQRPLWSPTGQRERRTGVCLEVHLSWLFAKVTWRRAKDIAQERRETVCFPSGFVFPERLKNCLCQI